MMLTVQRAWEEYLHSSSKNEEVKFKKLDHFLHLLYEIITGDKIIDFGKMQGVSNILSGEFLVDVHKICSDTDGNDGAVKLENYLIHGRGCIILKVLNTIGVRELSSSKDLAELLLSILPLCLKFSRIKQGGETTEWSMPDLYKCFTAINYTTYNQRKKNTSKFPQITEMSTKKLESFPKPKKEQESKKSRRLTPLGSFLASTVKSTLKATTTMRGPENLLNKGVGNVDVKANFPTVLSSTHSRFYYSKSESTESDDNALPTPYLDNNHPQQQRLGVFRGVLSPNTSDNNDEGDKIKAISNTNGSETELVPLPKCDLDPMELCFIILNIIMEICQDNSRRLEMITKKHVAGEILQQLVQLLNLVQEECQNASEEDEELCFGWSVIDYVKIERMLIRAIFTGMYSLGTQGNGVTQLQNTGVLHVLITFGQLQQVWLNTAIHSACDEVRKERCLLCLELNEGVFELFLMILKTIAVNPSSISTTLSMVKEYALNVGFEMIKNFIDLNDKMLVELKNDLQLCNLVTILSALTTKKKKVPTATLR